MTTRTTLERAQRLIKAATGGPYGDGHTVMNVLTGYTTGPKDDNTVIVLGNWNPKRFAFQVKPGDLPITLAERMPERLANALAAIGAECEWYDEWDQCGNCHRALRTTPTHYGWTMDGAFSESIGEYTCSDCMLESPEDYLTDYIGEASNAITWMGRPDLEALGFIKWEPGNEHDYESGWHPGQTDDPHAILASILDTHPDAEVVFLIDGVGQFDIAFSAHVRRIGGES